MKKMCMTVCMAMCLALPLAACGRGGGAGEGKMPGGGDADSSSSQERRQDREWVYVPEVVTVGDEYTDYEGMQLVKDTFCYVSQGGDMENSEKTICRYCLTDRELTSVPLFWPQGGENWDVGMRVFDGDCNVYLTANVYPADYSSMKRFLCKFDPEGNCLFSRDITEQTERDASPERMTADASGRLYLFTDNGEILLYTGDGDYHGTVSCAPSDSLSPIQIRGTCDGADGKYYVCISKGGVDMEGSNSGAKQGSLRTCLMEIDFEGVGIQEAVGELPDMKGICTGIRQESDSAGKGSGLAGQGGNASGEDDESGNQYDLLLYDNKAVYGYDFDAQKKNPGSAGEELFRWMDSDVNGYCVRSLYELKDGGLCATVEDWRNDDRAIVLLKRTKAEQAPIREELSLATVGGGCDLAAMAVKFNRGNSQYHLTVKNYASLTELYQAVLTNQPMDLVDLSGIHAQQLAAQGFFEDLSPYVEKSTRFGRSDFVEGILDVYTFGDTLAGIPAGFTLKTVIGNGAGRENGTGLTLQELLEDAQNPSKAAAFDEVTREEMLQYLMMFNEDTFIDRESCVCHFDSESFREVLEYVNLFPESLKGSEEISLPARIRNGEVRFAIAELNALRAFQEYEGMFGEGAACIGFPTADGRGGHLLFTGDAYAIAAASEHKEGAWSFIEGFLAQEKGEDYYANPDNGLCVSFPTLKKVLDERVEKAIEKDGQYESDKFPEQIYSDGTTFQYHALTWNEVNVMLKLVPDAKPYFDAQEDAVIQIISEEASAYFSGQKGIEDVTGVIQNRVQLYLNENGS